MDEVNYIPGDEVIISFTIKSISGEMYNINKLSLSKYSVHVEDRTHGDDYLFSGPYVFILKRSHER